MANVKATMTDIRVIIRELSRGTSLREMERKLQLRCWIRSRFTIFRKSTGAITCKQFRFTVECIQMVIGYLDIFVFEEFVLALQPVVDGGDCVLQADPEIVVPDEIYRGQH